jgi:hypothetical protein
MGPGGVSRSAQRAAERLCEGGLLISNCLLILGHSISVIVHSRLTCVDPLSSAVISYSPFVNAFEHAAIVTLAREIGSVL